MEKNERELLDFRRFNTHDAHFRKKGELERGRGGRQKSGRKGITKVGLYPGWSKESQRGASNNTRRRVIEKKGVLHLVL